MTNQFPDATKMVFPPNDLSHLSDEEFNALAPQGYHATGPAEPLSPAAQAVVDAYNSRWDNDLAAALRAAADQVVPTTVDPRLSTVRSDLMRIARELEASPND
jgi:hypothetical protein